MPEGLVDRTEPWESIEGEWQDDPTDLVRNARMQAVRLLNAFGASLESVLAWPDCTVRDVKVRFFGICGALGLNLMDGRSFTEIADELGCTRASLSKVACEFCAANNLEPSFMMKAGSSHAVYQTARIASIQRAKLLPAVPAKGRRV